ncbi:protocatechuate 3,4-dioxygenase beta subunit [Algoriphagus alkaliphilus]|uniref:Protocatechuate 3,4-dioxygenase beta subunit n=1 Tax=Algoriphagus alkaliphilus TaxID=279824 RepID=A0A1G5UYG8_9BACT|nr:intradiol ring-cleavage dioxygenase [Algoriphagus alkaliphilus]SDA37795.1 protocatechuate 3,4-dioxygenase beta subunit [Algoriphagus alkaliphilus]
MNRILNRCLILFCLFLNFNCTAQSRKLVGGGCEGCEAIFEFGEKTLSPIDTLPDFDSTEPKLKLTGTVLHLDGKTPARDVILYIYHTDRTGIYPKKGNESGWARRHGYIRGWIKTDQSGNYTFYTFRPAAYPDRTEAEHIHLTVKEPDKNEYYLDDFLFEDDPILTQEKRTLLSNRGGSGIGIPKLEKGILTFHRDIILGLNIPDYKLNSLKR